MMALVHREALSTAFRMGATEARATRRAGIVGQFRRQKLIAPTVRFVPWGDPDQSYFPDFVLILIRS